MNDKTRKILRWVGAYAIVTVIAAVAYYIALPPINLQSESFWIFLAFLLFLYTLPLSGLRVNKEVLRAGEFKLSRPKKDKKARLMYLAILPLAVLLLGNILSST